MPSPPFSMTSADWKDGSSVSKKGRKMAEVEQDAATEPEAPRDRARRALEELRAITFLGPNDPPLRDSSDEWDPNPRVRARRALARLRAIKF
jgi:hypothetical protein